MKDRSVHELATLRVQTKLIVGPADDHYEREADSVARQVMTRISTTSATPAADASTASAQVSRAAMEEDELLQGKRIRRAAMEEDELLQGKRIPLVQRATESAAVGPEGGDVDSTTAARINSARSGGQPLDTAVRRSMEGAFGADFSSVRMHVGGGADRLNAELGARAFTTGSDVFMRSQDYRPGTRSGQELLAHELTHVVQQGAASSLDQG